MNARTLLASIFVAGSLMTSVVALPATAQADGQYVHIYVPGHSGRHHWRVAGTTPEGNIILELGPTARHPFRPREAAIVTPQFLAGATGSSVWLTR